MPTTSVANSSGTISDLIIRRNTDDKTFRSVAAQPPCASRALSGNAQPKQMPNTIATRIHCDSEMRRKNDLGATGGWSSVGTEVGCISLLRKLVRDRTRPSPKGRVPVTVCKVKHEADDEPPAEPDPSQLWQALHNEYA